VLGVARHPLLPELEGGVARVGRAEPRAEAAAREGEGGHAGAEGLRAEGPDRSGERVAVGAEAGRRRRVVVGEGVVEHPHPRLVAAGEVERGDGVVVAWVRRLELVRALVEHGEHPRRRGLARRRRPPDDDRGHAADGGEGGQQTRRERAGAGEDLEPDHAVAAERLEPLGHGGGENEPGEVLVTVAHEEEGEGGHRRARPRDVVADGAGEPEDLGDAGAVVVRQRRRLGGGGRREEHEEGEGAHRGRGQGGEPTPRGRARTLGHPPPLR
jgi:hypothetical protein